jgi:predicted AlkP superfamily phosphohydrolase/phosphomutase/tetratricopeptide (TPR) repeat protein
MASRKVVLVGWDAADWKVIRPLMDAGKMPNVTQLVLQGASGQIATLHPPISPMLWTSIATGKRPFKHGIHGFSEPTPDGRGVQPVSNLSRKSKALWNILNQNDLRSIVIGWWPSHPAEPIDGVMVSDHYHRAGGPLAEAWPLRADCVHPRELADTLAALRVHPEVLAPELVEQFIPLAREIDQDQDQRLALFLRTLAECMSIHAAATWLIANRPWDFFAVYYDAIDHFCHGFMKYHAPRQSWIEPRDFELYGNVVSMAYQFHDRMLGTLLREAGEDTTVILMSDHGFHPDHLRPASIPDIPAGPTIEHRDFGILAMRGPGIKQDELLHGASVLDVAPTILKLYELPVGGDMDGKVLARAFVENTNVAMIPSWEDVPGADGRHPPHMRFDPVAAHEALEQMIALGYIERLDENREIAVARTIRELRYNLGEAYQDGDRHIEAREIFAELHAADPDEQRFVVRLFVSCQALGLIDEMGRIVAEEASRVGQAVPPAGFNSSFPDGRRNRLPHNSPVVDYLEAQLLTAEKRYAEALAVLERVTETHMVRPGLFLQTGDLYLRLGRWRDAQQVYEKALAIDPDHAQAHVGICRIALSRRKYDAAAHSALDALQRVHHFPQAHFLLGRALSGMKEYARAAEAYRAAVSINPNYPEAHVRLAALLEKYLGDAEAGREHRRLAREMRSRKASRRVHKDAGDVSIRPDSPSSIETAEIPPLADTLIVVTGLPRSGTSLLMQMLAAGGMDILSDGLREADEDNPRGYLEFEPVKNLFNDAKWLLEKRGKAVKIVVPLLAALPHGLACRVILSERDLDQILDSQERMLLRRGQPPTAAPERRRMLKEEYARTVSRVKAMLAQRPGTRLLVIQHRDAISDPLSTAGKLNEFLGGRLDVTKMASAIDTALHRNRASVSACRESP